METPLVSRNIRALVARKCKLRNQLDEATAELINECSTLKLEDFSYSGAAKQEGLLSMRVCNALMYTNWIYTVGDLIRNTRKEYTRMPNVGLKGVEEISTFLKSLGLSFKDED